MMNKSRPFFDRVAIPFGISLLILVSLTFLTIAYLSENDLSETEEGSINGWWKLAIGIPVFMVLLLLEKLIPFAADKKPEARHKFRNFFWPLVNALPGALIVAFGLLVVAHHMGNQGRGLLPWLGLTGAASAGVGILLLDFWMYFWHRANHTLPLLWRFHRMHHTDPVLDASSAFRFHIGEMVLSGFFRIGVVAVLGLQIRHIVLYETLLLPVILFHHSFIILPDKLDRALRYIIVTPGMHHVHHSVVQAETDSNYASIFSGWDRLFGSYRERQDLQSLDFGLEEFRHTGWQGVWGMLKTPFVKVRRGEQTKL
jgi:sterol desaturase/sphingolipid hydroxylase (fatty acid hydroxylase superfamily)